MKYVLLVFLACSLLLNVLLSLFYVDARSTLAGTEVTVLTQADHIKNLTTQLNGLDSQLNASISHIDALEKSSQQITSQLLDAQNSATLAGNRAATDEKQLASIHKYLTLLSADRLLLLETRHQTFITWTDVKEYWDRQKALAADSDSSLVWDADKVRQTLDRIIVMVSDYEQLRAQQSSAQTDSEREEIQLKIQFLVTQYWNAIAAYQSYLQSYYNDLIVVVVNHISSLEAVS